MDIIPYSAKRSAAVKKKRAKRQTESSPVQKNLNEKHAAAYFRRTAILNFGEGDHLISLDYNNRHLPESYEAADRNLKNYLRRLAYHRKRKGLPPLKYMAVTEGNAPAGDGEGEPPRPPRIHHHIFVNGGLDRDEMEDLWRRPRRKGQKQGDKIGRTNTINLQPSQYENGLCGILADYIMKESRKRRAGKHSYICSHNLKRPRYKLNDDRYSRRKIEQLATLSTEEQIAFFEKRYPGWRVVTTKKEPEFGCRFEQNEFTGYHVYLRLIRKE
ncbi:MAG: hypothetical protein U0M15_05720 [Bacillota bacterium]|nr:hypothetical protein [Bacillota bacterium]